MQRSWQVGDECFAKSRFVGRFFRLLLLTWLRARRPDAEYSRAMVLEVRGAGIMEGSLAFFGFCTGR
jgi:hypothetical protein